MTRLVGCAMAYQEENYFTFCYMTIDQDYRPNGLGTKFVQELITEARQLKRGIIRIALRESLIENIKFVTRLDFVRTLKFTIHSYYICEMRITK